MATKTKQNKAPVADREIAYKIRMVIEIEGSITGQPPLKEDTGIYPFMQWAVDDIERNVLIEEMNKVTNDSTCPLNIAADVYQACTDIPAADAAPVVHAAWSVIRFDKTDIFDYSFKCSNCKGETPRKAYLISPDFCPNCGAKMDAAVIKGGANCVV